MSEPSGAGGGAPDAGVWSVRLPFPNPLGHTWSYLVEVDGGLLVIDAGWDSEEGWRAFCAGLSAAGAGLSDLVGVVITHVHPDHYGLAARLREHSRAWIGMHPLEAVRIPRDDAEVAATLQQMIDWLLTCGAPPAEVDALRAAGSAIARTTSMVRPDLLLLDGQQVPGTTSMTVVHTPGHTAGHLCFLDEQRRVLFTGDHVLPRITPNVSLRPQSGDDPLGHFRRSIAKVRGLGVVRALPGHEWPMEDLDARIDVLTDHHDARLEEVRAVLADGASTVWEVAATVSWSRSWDSLRGLQRRSAVGETHAHLERLVREGRVQRRPGPPDRWTPCPERGSPADRG